MQCVKHTSVLIHSLQGLCVILRMVTVFIHDALYCSHAGVFLTEGGDRYALSFEGAKDHCLKLRSELASEEQVRVAYDKGLETCR
uniref:Link domain-containing protein n=1 Tax=Denticeps clupeoides TaxID=299321 RepID=A0AAY4B4V8_9TELE